MPFIAMPWEIVSKRHPDLLGTIVRKLDAWAERKSRRVRSPAELHWYYSWDFQADPAFHDWLNDPGKNPRPASESPDPDERCKGRCGLLRGVRLGASVYASGSPRTSVELTGEIPDEVRDAIRGQCGNDAPMTRQGG